MKLLPAIAVVSIVGVSGWWRARRGMDRERQLMLLCQRAGLRFAPLDPFQDLWLPFPIFGRGTARGTENTVWQSADDGSVRVFDFWYEERGEDAKSWPTKKLLTCAVVELPFTVPRLTVEPLTPLDLAATAIEGTRIELELEAFNERFSVHAADPRFAVAFLDQRMMQALLGLPDHVSLVVGEDRLLLHAPLLPAPQVLLLLDVAGALRTHVPAVVASLYPPRPMKGPNEDRWLAGSWTPEPTGSQTDRSRER